LTDEVVWMNVPDFPGYMCSSLGVVVGPSGRAVRTWDYDGRGLRWLKIDTGVAMYSGPVWLIVVQSFYRGKLDDISVEFMDGNVANSAVTNLNVVFNGVQKGRKRPLTKRK
jgi:hypothetical protein